jgi:hypothetical protein
MSESLPTNAPSKPKRSLAATCLLLNQFATPGLGSLMARRWFAGTGQLVLAVAGFCLLAGWFIQVCIQFYRLMGGLPETPPPYPWLGKAGGLLFLAAWLWAWVTSLSVLRQARLNTPPRLP